MGTGGNHASITFPIQCHCSDAYAMKHSILPHALKKVMNAATTYLMHCQEQQQLTSEVIQLPFTISLELLQKPGHS
eukprot:15331189-Ditylum_brightwellii.AAC.1